MYLVVERKGRGLVVVRGLRGEALWAKTSRAVRKNQACSICERLVEKGAELMYRPMGNPYDRMRRICVSCVEGDEEE